MIRDRLLEAIYQELPKKGAIATLSKESKIPSTSWQNVASGRQRATEEMIEFVCRKWPRYINYIAAGLEENEDQTTPERERIEKLDLNIENLYKKEPIDWSKDEAIWVKQTEELQLSNFVSKEYKGLHLLLKCRDEKKLLAKFIADQRASFKEKFDHLPSREIIEGDLAEAVESKRKRRIPEIDFKKYKGVVAALHDQTGYLSFEMEVDYLKAMGAKVD